LALPYSGDFTIAPGSAKIMPTVNKELHSKALFESAKAAEVEKNKRGLRSPVACCASKKRW
jgi:hypothetical protein